MRAFIIFASLAAVLPSLAVPTGNVPVSKFAGHVKAGSYIVTLKDGVDKESHLKSVLSQFVAGSDVQYKYGDVFHGYAVNLKGKDLDFIRQSKDIEFIEEDGIVSLEYSPGDTSPISERAVPKAKNSVRASGGSGVDIYVIDTGIYTAHSEFGGRARWGGTFGGYANQDGRGHGTHVAGIAAGATYGQAPQANLIAVKVLSDSGSGTNSDVISGVNYAYNQFKATGRPSVASMSFGSPRTAAVNQAVSDAINGGLHFTVAAGNDNRPASGLSPASVPTANTVGAIDSSNTKASFSNYDFSLDVWAPGVDILSAWIGSTTATKRTSGTSMAASFVAGILAVALSEYGQVTPDSLTSSLQSHAQPIVNGAPSGTVNLKATKW